MSEALHLSSAVIYSSILGVMRSRLHIQVIKIMIEIYIYIPAMLTNTSVYRMNSVIKSPYLMIYTQYQCKYGLSIATEVVLSIDKSIAYLIYYS